jgi:hypothetical protein
MTVFQLLHLHGPHPEQYWMKLRPHHLLFTLTPKSKKHFKILFSSAKFKVTAVN